MDFRKATARVDPVACGMWSVTFWLRCLRELKAVDKRWLSEARVWKWMAKCPVEDRFFPHMVELINLLL